MDPSNVSTGIFKKNRGSKRNPPVIFYKNVQDPVSGGKIVPDPGG
jgi:hypothetical protein